MRSRLLHIGLLGLALVFAVCVDAGELLAAGGLPAQLPNERPLRGRPLLTAALALEDTSAADTNAALKFFDAWLINLRDEDRIDEPVGRRGERLLTALHRDVLTGEYRSEATAVGEALLHGQFNCVSATLLFQCAADELSLDARPMLATRHVFCRVRGETQVFDVETTCATWLGQLRLETEPGHTAKNEYREATGRQLLAAIPYNRGVDLVKRRDFAAAVAANQQALQLDSDHRGAQANLLAAYNNWALQEGATGNFTAALAILRVGQALAPDHEPFRANEVYLRTEWATQLRLNAGR